MPATCPRLTIEALHLGIGVGKDDPALVGLGLAGTIPTIHQLAACLLARVGRVDHAALVIGMDRLAVRPVASARVASRCQSSRCRRISVISAAPCRSVTLRNAAPAPIACNCSGSPTITTFAPASRAWDSTRSIWREPILGSVPVEGRMTP